MRFVPGSIPGFVIVTRYSTAFFERTTASYYCCLFFNVMLQKVDTPGGGTIGFLSFLSVQSQV